MQKTTKKKWKDALNRSFEKLKGYSFEAFGVESYPDTFYRDGMTIAEMKENISRSEGGLALVAVIKTGTQFKNAVVQPMKQLSLLRGQGKVNFVPGSQFGG